MQLELKAGEQKIEEMLRTNAAHLDNQRLATQMQNDRDRMDI